MASGLHHFHKRKRKLKGKSTSQLGSPKKLKSPYETPSRNKLKGFMDTIIYIVAVLGPLIAIPQVLKIWHAQDATGVSLITWVGYLAGGFFWLTYGVLHKEKPIVITNTLWIFVQIFIIVGIVRYG
jgi:uncharacterized protein with PQ loop repeat